MIAKLESMRVEDVAEESDKSRSSRHEFDREHFARGLAARPGQPPIRWFSPQSTPSRLLSFVTGPRRSEAAPTWRNSFPRSLITDG